MEQVRASEVWRLVVKSDPGVVHAERAPGPVVGSRLSWCGVYGIPLTFEHGELVNGCLACVSEMAASRAAP